jgi:peptidoglycan-associated lipoprotein
MGLLARTGTTRTWLFACVTLSALIFMAGCKPNYPKCKEDDHCAEHGEVCVDGTCKQCRDDKQCKPGFECKAGACAKKPECLKNEDCTKPLICKAQKCVPECTTDADCSSNKFCTNQQCVPRTECDSAHPCANGHPCEGNKCVEPPKQPEVVTPPVVAPQCELGTVHFGFNDYALSEEARSQLEKNADCLKQRKQAVTIEGHCDERGTEEFNIALGNKRADAARRYLVGLGVSGDTIGIVSYGKERPKDPGHNEEAWSVNRRGEFVLR